MAKEVITEYNTLDFENLVSIRANLRQNDLIQIFQEINRVIKESTTEKNGPVITATYSSQMEDEEMVMDMEILCPVKNKIELPDGYVFKPLFHLVNAVKLEYEGHPNEAASIVQNALQYIAERNWMPITPIYNIVTYEPKSKEELEKYAMSIYIGVSENIL